MARTPSLSFGSISAIGQHQSEKQKTFQRVHVNLNPIKENTKYYLPNI
jgi:hypothetical protein